VLAVDPGRTDSRGLAERSARGRPGRVDDRAGASWGRARLVGWVRSPSTLVQLKG